MSDAIRWALARWLPGMREACRAVQTGTYEGWHTNPASTVAVHNPRPSKFNGGSICPGYQPIPLDGEEISVGRLIQAIEAEGYKVKYQSMDEAWWTVAGEGYAQIGFDPDLAVAFLKAQGDWPLKEVK